MWVLCPIANHIALARGDTLEMFSSNTQKHKQKHNEHDGIF
jgi:hypothetical protein